MIKIKNWFELNQKYKFEVTDLTTLIYVLCTILGIIGINITPLFLIGSIIATAFSWQGHRINLVVLNASLFLLNLVNFIKMFQQLPLKGRPLSGTLSAVFLDRVPHLERGCFSPLFETKSKIAKQTKFFLKIFYSLCKLPIEIYRLVWYNTITK